MAKYVVARNSAEYSKFVKYYGQDSVRLISGWFMPPFAIPYVNNDDDDDEVLSLKEYGLAMVGADREGGLMEYCDFLEERGVPLVVFSDQPDISSNNLKHHPNMVIRRRCLYGSKVWYDALSRCQCFYEPVPRLTTSLLEALWFGKKVYSDFSLEINDLLGRECVSGLYLDSVPSKPDKYLLSHFFAQTQAATLVNSIKV
jgi:hypothetical protein